MVIDAMKAGALIVAGTDRPNAINLHGELMAYTLAGMTNFDALKAATVNPARALALDAGTIEAGKLADLVMVDGDPLARHRRHAESEARRSPTDGSTRLNQLINGAGSSRTTAR